jgi:hypothetical protein
MKKNVGDLKMSLKQARKLYVLERLWGTLQHRLVVDMRLAGVSTIEEANKRVMRVMGVKRVMGVRPTLLTIQVFC